METSNLYQTMPTLTLSSSSFFPTSSFSNNTESTMFCFSFLQPMFSGVVLCAVTKSLLFHFLNVKFIVMCREPLGVGDTLEVWCVFR